MNYLKHESIVRALANTWITAVLLIWGMTELLSVFKLWETRTVLGIWLLLLGILIIECYRKKYLAMLCRKLIQEKLSEILKTHRFWICAFGIFFFVVLVCGILSSQYNVDAMVYHLPRIMHWMQNKSVNHFAAGFEAQIRYPCLSEYLVAQMYLFDLTDRLANLIQTFAYIISGVMVYGISRKIGASYKASFTATAVYFAMPMAAVQAFSTQTDNIACLFLLTYIFYILDFIQAEELKMDRQGFISAVLLASNVLLGYLCKPTICFVMVVFFVWMCVARFIKRDKLPVLVKYMILGGCTAIILFIPTYVKNYQTYTSVDKKIVAEKRAEAIESGGNPEEVDAPPQIINPGQALTPDVYNVQVALQDPGIFILTGLQNIAQNSLSICFPENNKKWFELVTNAGEFFGRDTGSFRVWNDTVYFFYQDMASNPWIMLLTLLVTISVIFRISKTNKEQTLYVMCAVVGFVVQCGMMGYTPYRTRYLVGAMAVLCPAIAVTIDRLRLKTNGRDIVLALCIFGAGIGLINVYSYEIPRIQESLQGDEIHQYMLGAEEDEFLYAEMVNVINARGYQTIGLDGLLYMEYPLWQTVDELQRLENVNLTDAYFAQYEDLTFVPDCIVKSNGEDKPIQEGDRLECHGEEYQCIWSIHWFQMYYGVFSKEAEEDEG